VLSNDEMDAALDARLPETLMLGMSPALGMLWSETKLDVRLDARARFFGVAAIGMTTEGSAALEKRGAVVAVIQFSWKSRDVEGPAVERIGMGTAGTWAWAVTSTSSSFNEFSEDWRSVEGPGTGAMGSMSSWRRTNDADADAWWRGLGFDTWGTGSDIRFVRSFVSEPSMINDDLLGRGSTWSTSSPPGVETTIEVRESGEGVKVWEKRL